MRILIAGLFCIIATCGFAQRKAMTWGYLKDSLTHKPIELASITNVTTGKTVITSATGLFSIEASENNVISFAAIGYHFDTIQYTRRLLLQDTLQLELTSLGRDLGNVTVTGRRYTRYQLDSMERRKDFFQTMVDYKIPTVARANSGAGIALNLDRFSRHEKNKRKAFDFYERNEKEAYINYRFTRELVTEYTGFKDNALRSFMQQYRPSYEWLRSNTSEEDMKYYINDKLKESKK